MKTPKRMASKTNDTRQRKDLKPRQPKAGLRQQLEMFELIFDCIYNGIMVTDGDGYVTHFNKPYGQFLGLDPVEQLGKHCTEVIENTRMHLVAQTGQAEINQSHLIKGQNMVVQRIPIWKKRKSNSRLRAGDVQGRQGRRQTGWRTVPVGIQSQTL